MTQREIYVGGRGSSSRCDSCKIRHAGICGTLTPAELAELSNMAINRQYTAGQMIRMEEEPITFYANVVSGVAKAFKSTSDGRQQIVGLLLQSDFLDRVFTATAPCSIEAVTDIKLCSYPKLALEAMILKDPELERRLFDMTLIELDQAQDWMLLLGRGTAREKVATFLLMLARRAPYLLCPYDERERNKHSTSAQDTSKMVIAIPVTRSDMGDYLGLTTETVCRQMTTLKKEGIISLPDNHSFMVPDLNRLALQTGQHSSIDN
jgi:CRP/FNR family transcriptional regulator